MPCSLSACTWLMPGSLNSTGSSTVEMFVFDESMFVSIVYIVVVLPDPVGPVMMIMPCGLSSRSLTIRVSRSCMPSASKVKTLLPSSITRMTIFSPPMTGIALTRKLARVPFSSIDKFPSCGLRVSVVSMSPMTLIRPTTAASVWFGIVMTWVSWPSTRYLTRIWGSCGSR